MTPPATWAGPMRRRRLLSGERGVVMIQVALASIVLLGFCGLAIDYGVFWVARAQAQNAADAGALAAATSLAFDVVTDPPSGVVTATGLAQQGAVAVASRAAVWGKPPVVPEADITFCEDVTPTCPAIKNLPLPQERTLFSATVKVYADKAHKNPLPTYFAALFGVKSQDVQAQATAAVAPANTATCVWPLAIPDLWEENSDPQDKTFSKYQYPPSAPPLTTPDSYYPPESIDPLGSGLEVSRLTLGPTLVDPLTITELLTGPAVPTPDEPWPAIDQSHFVAVQIPRSDGGGFVANLTSCNQLPVRIGDALTLDTSASFAQVQAGAAARRAQDPGASWTETQRIRGSCAADLPPCAPISPRLVAVPMFDPDLYDATRGSTRQIKIVNFAGLFIDSVTGEIVGYLSTYPGAAEYGHPFVPYGFAFLRTAILTR